MKHHFTGESSNSLLLKIKILKETSDLYYQLQNIKKGDIQ